MRSRTDQIIKLSPPSIAWQINAITATAHKLARTRIKEKEELGVAIAEYTQQKIKGSLTLVDLLRCPGFHYLNLDSYGLGNKDLDRAEKEGAKIDRKYSGYIKRHENQIEQIARHSNLKLPSNLDHMTIDTLSMEAREKLTKVKPLAVGQASRIGGVNPADINALLVYLEVRRRAIA